MLARFNWRQIETNQLDQVLEKYRSTIVPDRLSKQGNEGAFVFVDRQSGKLLAVSLWATEQDMKAAMSSIPPDVDETTGSTAEVEVFDVAISND